MREAVAALGEITTVEGARARVVYLTEEVEAARAVCDLAHDCSLTRQPMPGSPVVPTVAHVQKTYVSWAMRYGQALGSLTTFFQCRLLNEVAYEELRQRVLSTGVPRVRFSI